MKYNPKLLVLCTGIRNILNLCQSLNWDQKSRLIYTLTANDHNGHDVLANDYDELKEYKYETNQEHSACRKIIGYGNLPS
jgi:hypothetical protein